MVNFIGRIKKLYNKYLCKINCDKDYCGSNMKQLSVDGEIIVTYNTSYT